MGRRTNGMDGKEVGDVIARNPKDPDQVENGQPMIAIKDEAR